MILKRIEKWSRFSVLPVEDTSHISHIGKRGVQNQPSLALPIDHLSYPKVSSAAYSFEKPFQEAMDRGALFGHLIPKLHQKKKLQQKQQQLLKDFFFAWKNRYFKGNQGFKMDSAAQQRKAMQSGPFVAFMQSSTEFYCFS